jgi:transposase-like protein
LRVLKMGVTKIHIAREYGVSAATVNIWARKNLRENC